VLKKRVNDLADDPSSDPAETLALAFMPSFREHVAPEGGVSPSIGGSRLGGESIPRLSATAFPHGVEPRRARQKLYKRALQ